MSYIINLVGDQSIIIGEDPTDFLFHDFILNLTLNISILNICCEGAVEKKKEENLKVIINIFRIQISKKNLLLFHQSNILIKQKQNKSLTEI